ncbi:MAG: HAD hydrolase family protein [Ignavibacteriales bacterium]|nr:HAD hydrolase family protein [Ignavibacteriales bacterium]MCF8316724.1 HAD hydrolase family protein [Ignavibacteriales bacterium]MCF8436042.1 HAD hydrolase family protein [Ignavibacteriales bacterium]
MFNDRLIKRASSIKLMVTDIDGVMTDTSIYYSSDGEELKRFSVRDGMGVERLRKFANIETVIMTGENSDIVLRRAEKLKIRDVYMGVKNKADLFPEVAEIFGVSFEEIAYIGDDTNDIEVMRLAGLSACPADATSFAKAVADIVVESKGGSGAFRDFAEFIISAKTLVNKSDEKELVHRGIL